MSDVLCYVESVSIIQHFPVLSQHSAGKPSNAQPGCPMKGGIMHLTAGNPGTIRYQAGTISENIIC